MFGSQWIISMVSLLYPPQTINKALLNKHCPASCFGWGGVSKSSIFGFDVTFQAFKGGTNPETSATFSSNLLTGAFLLYPEPMALHHTTAVCLRLRICDPWKMWRFSVLKRKKFYSELVVDSLTLIWFLSKDSEWLVGCNGFSCYRSCVASKLASWHGHDWTRLKHHVVMTMMMMIMIIIISMITILTNINFWFHVLWFSVFSCSFTYVYSTCEHSVIDHFVEDDWTEQKGRCKGNHCGVLHEGSRWNNVF